MGTAAENRRMLESCKVVGNGNNRVEWLVRGRNKYKNEKFGHIEGEIDYQDKNSFEALREEEWKEEEENKEDKKDEVTKESTKEWVNKKFWQRRGRERATKGAT